ncbi:hypothetical protein EZV73_12865 [Acidaminobacter sp. JC074]|uniref:D-alanyl-D-alanine carboxypeptidase family protein n=1 Tax=Acidaminobacter sp. JC074 TaxID=2530199 RepID=UPI001F0F39A8|nr:D-alanyl-D-alanine carboxypeptidase family protein [Acidaminobacter sp. JC074]MCH4888476.1 hypothetical protein [Acidaminobacter sp. JC074]
MKKLILLCSLLLVGCQNNAAINDMNVSLPDDNTIIVDFEEEERVEETQIEETESEEIIENEVIDMVQDDVYWLQESLKIAGYYTARDGAYGPGTEKKLHEFQRDYNLVEGPFDTLTKDAMEQVRKEKLAPGIGTPMVLLNKHYYLPASYVPDGLREVDVDKNKYMELPDEVASIVEQMFKDAEADGIHIVLASAYRSYDYQEGIFSRRVASNGFEEAETVVAIPGESEHQTGLAIDITSAAMNYGLDQTFENDPAFDWMMENAYKYGFILRYLKGREEETGYIYEPWHYRYIGDVKASQYIMEKGLILEEYLNE